MKRLYLRVKEIGIYIKENKKINLNLIKIIIK